jgi:cation diffusion facilitator CzcD-associated flavoprotein CzcO
MGWAMGADNNTSLNTSDGLRALEATLARDLDLIHYPTREWVISKRTVADQNVLDVLIIGGGQGGLAAAFGLMREKVNNILVIDENAEKQEGPWLTFARMHTLRTPKHITGPDHGIPSLTVRAWYEAQYGADAWQKLGFLPKELWAEYLHWYRKTLKLPVQNNTRAYDIEWLETEKCFVVPVEKNGVKEKLYARVIVLATGIDGSGRWEMPDFITSTLPKSLYAHTREDIDFALLKGKRIGVLGAGASAFDNASVALEADAGEVRMFFRREKLPVINPYRWAEFVGFLKHHADLPDAIKWRFIHKFITMGQLPPGDTYSRARKFSNFHLHNNSAWQKVEHVNNVARVITNQGQFDFDFLLIGTGFVTDLSLRPELSKLYDQIALWSHRYTPPTGERQADLERHPYLGTAFEFQEKSPGNATYLASIFNYTFGCLPSLGLGGASISGMKYSLLRLVSGVTRRLYLDDAEGFYKSLEHYDLHDFEVDEIPSTVLQR